MFSSIPIPHNHAGGDINVTRHELEAICSKVLLTAFLASLSLSAWQRIIEVYPVVVRLPLLFLRAGGWAEGGLAET